MNAEAINLVQKAYIAYYGRPADPAGLAFWASDLEANGLRLERIINAFGNSAESQALYSGSTTEQRVTQVYRQLFDREPDAPGLAYWSGLINQGAITLQAYALAVLNGARNEDLSLVEKKLVVAKQFTDTLTQQSAGHTYAGEDDANDARAFLSQVTLTSDPAQFTPIINELISAIYDNNWLTYGGNLTRVDSDNFISAPNNAYYTNSIYSSLGPSTSNSRDIFISKLSADFSTPIQAIIGDANNQYVAASVVKSDNGLALAGQYGSSNAYAYVSTLNPELTAIESVLLGNGSGGITINHMTVDNAGRIIIVGHQSVLADSQDAYILTLNPDMSVYAERRVDAPQTVNSRETFDYVVTLSDNSIIAVSGNRMIKFDQDLRIQTALELNILPREIIEKDNGELLVIGTGRVASSLVEVTLMDSNLNVLNAWADNKSGNLYVPTLNNSNDLVTYHNGSLGDSSRNILTFDLNDFSQDADSVTSNDAKYILDRAGRLISPDDIIHTGENFSVLSGANIFTFKPNHETSPNLSSDYRVIENPVEMTLTSRLKTTPNTPSLPSSTGKHWMSVW